MENNFVNYRIRLLARRKALRQGQQAMATSETGSRQHLPLLLLLIFAHVALAVVAFALRGPLSEALHREPASLKVPQEMVSMLSSDDGLTDESETDSNTDTQNDDDFISGSVSDSVLYDLNVEDNLEDPAPASLIKTTKKGEPAAASQDAASRDEAVLSAASEDDPVKIYRTPTWHLLLKAPNCKIAQAERNNLREWRDHRVSNPDIIILPLRIIDAAPPVDAKGCIIDVTAEVPAKCRKDVKNCSSPTLNEQQSNTNKVKTNSSDS